MDRVIGILGGMGPEATIDLYRHIVALTPAERDQDHIRTVIVSNPKIPDRTLAILEGGEDPLPHLIEAAQILQRAGAGILAIPCNAAHHFLRPLQLHSRIRILSMIDETCHVFQSSFPGARAVGVLGASGTIRSGIYRTIFGSVGVEVIVPPEEDQRRVQWCIGAVKAAKHGPATAETFESVGRALVRAGADAVILGCTEIPLAFDQSRAGYPTLNPTRILAQAAVDWALGRRD